MDKSGSKMSTDEDNNQKEESSSGGQTLAAKPPPTARTRRKPYQEGRQRIERKARTVQEEREEVLALINAHVEKVTRKTTTQPI